MSAGLPLFSCPDVASLMENANDLSVTCRIVSVRATLTELKVRVYGEAENNITIDARLADHETEDVYGDDNRYVVKVMPDTNTVRIYASTLSLSV